AHEAARRRARRGSRGSPTPTLERRSRRSPPGSRPRSALGLRRRRARSFGKTGSSWSAGRAARPSAEPRGRRRRCAGERPQAARAFAAREPSAAKALPETSRISADDRQSDAEVDEEPEAPKPPAAQGGPDPTSALQLLSLLQREGRFVDFVQQDIDAHPDAD